MINETNKYSPDIKSHAWFVVIHLGNMKKAGLNDEQIYNTEFVADYFLKQWISSGKGRVGCVAVCESAAGVYHLHAALYGDNTTLRNVAKTMFDSHVEPAKGKASLIQYVLKEGKYREKDERVIYHTDTSVVQSMQGKRNDFDEIENLLQQGCSPEEIMDTQFRYRRYDKMIVSAYISKRKRDVGPKKKMYVEWHVGESGTGKTFTYEKLLQNYKKDEIYFTGSQRIGWLDYYMKAGAPDILFIDDLKPQGDFVEILSVMDVYTTKPIHARYEDIYPLWTKVIITSVYPPELWYALMVKDKVKKIDSWEQVRRRISVVVYHYVENGVYKEFRLPATQYVDYDSLKAMARIEVGDAYE